MKILLLSPAGSFATSLDSLGIDGSADSATGVSASGSDADLEFPVLRLGAGALPRRNRLSATLERSVIGRTAKRLTPLDGGFRFAAAARRNPAFRAAVADADLIVALERDAVLAAWTALRRWGRTGARGVFGLAPARALLTSQRAREGRG
ncbi:hypothetical protein [Microbacterium sp. NPDC089695]|uniref:hypothetical protein n=1 Tax=Microbacterium sp. NPDC089695 TaxID=3364198 RepID=UPI00381239CA